ncbi:hypothetical protein IZV00_14605 [Sphingobium sp. Cam5-1]|nr:hypothetical protein IZV00_14605 [Sphingobium sp. Cam5-1]
MAVCFVDRLNQIVEGAVAREREEPGKTFAKPMNIVLRQQPYRNNVFTGVHSRPLLNDDKRRKADLVPSCWSKAAKILIFLAG